MMGVSQVNRDLRLDLFRGLGLLVIYSNHVAEISHRSIFMIFSWRVFGVSDAAELFIFISGFLFGLLYYRTLLTEGFWACQKKALHRSLQIYLANLLTLVIVISIAYCFHRDQYKLLETSDLDPFFTHTLHAIRDFVLLDDMPGVFDVLFLYVLFIAFMPWLMLIFHHRPALAVALSLAVYLVSFKDPIMKLSGHFRFSVSALDPLAWQLLFFLGMIMGMKRRTNTLRIPVRPRWIRLAIAVLGVIFVLKMLSHAILWNFWGLGRLGGIVPWLLPWSGKLKLEPLRLVHFAALAYLAWILLPHDGRLLKTRLARWVINCGQHSLKIFCSSLVLSYLVCLIFTRVQPGLGVQFIIICGGWGVLLLIAHGLTKLTGSVKSEALVPLIMMPPGTEGCRSGLQD